MVNDKQEEKTIVSNEKDVKAKTDNQRPLLGIGAGILATLVGILILILISQKYKMPVMSVVVAFGIAWTIRVAGKTRDAWYGIVAAILSLIAALIGNIATGISIYCVKYPSMTPKAIVSNLNFDNIITLLQPVGWPMVILWSILSVVTGFWFSFKHPAKNQSIDIP